MLNILSAIKKHECTVLSSLVTWFTSLWKSSNATERYGGETGDDESPCRVTASNTRSVYSWVYALGRLTVNIVKMFQTGTLLCLRLCFGKLDFSCAFEWVVSVTLAYLWPPGPFCRWFVTRLGYVFNLNNCQSALVLDIKKSIYLFMLFSTTA